jgi:hypothetical protein
MDAAADIRAGVPINVRHLWMVLCVAVILVTIASRSLLTYYYFVDPAEMGSLDAGFARTADSGQRHVIVSRARAGSPVWQQGIRQGDHLRFDNPWDDLRMPFTGDRVAASKVAGRGEAAIVFTAAPHPPPTLAEQSLRVVGSVAGLVLLAVGLFILRRSSGVGSTLALGMAFICLAAAVPMNWPISSTAFPYWAVLVFAIRTAVAPLFLRFAMRYAARHGVQEQARTDRGEWLFFGLTLAQAVTFAVEIFSTLENFGIMFLQYIRPLSYSIQIATLLVATAYLVAGWRRSEPVTRQRYALMLAALPLTFCAEVIVLLQSLFGGFHIDTHSTFFVCTQLATLAGPVLFAYAVVQNKILDLGFAINRVLVYGIVSLIVLVGIGLLEWLAEYLVRDVGHTELTGNGQILTDAGIALAIFLFLHRVRDFVDHQIQALLFRAWQRNENDLKRFVRDADFVAKSASLSRDFVLELRRFCGGAQCAFYVLSDEQYRLQEGSIDAGPEYIDFDEPALVRLRADRLPADLKDTKSRLPATLALPMVHRGDLMGVILLGQKPSREPYRPDELVALGSAAHEIGLDLHALKAAQLEEANTRLQIKYDAVSALVSPPAQPKT